MKIIFLFCFLIILTSCGGVKFTEDGGPRHLGARSDGTECQLVCIGERIFPNNTIAGWTGVEDDPKRKNAEGKVKGYSFWGDYNPCIISRYAWNAFDQVEIDYGEQICSAQAAGSLNFINNSNKYDCSSSSTNITEKDQIRKSLRACEAKRGNIRKVTNSSTKTKEQIEKNEQQQKVNNAKKTCKDLGFTNQQDLADCALKILTTEKELNANVSSNNANEALARQMRLNNSIKLMQQGLKLMQPPKRNSINCMWTLLGWTCN